MYIDTRNLIRSLNDKRITNSNNKTINFYTHDIKIINKKLNIRDSLFSPLLYSHKKK